MSSASTVCSRVSFRSEAERRPQAAFGTTDTQADAIRLSDALLALTRLCLLDYPVDKT